MSRSDESGFGGSGPEFGPGVGPAVDLDDIMAEGAPRRWPGLVWHMAPGAAGLRVAAAASSGVVYLSAPAGSLEGSLEALLGQLLDASAGLDGADAALREADLAAGRMRAIEMAAAEMLRHGVVPVSAVWTGLGALRADPLAGKATGLDPAEPEFWAGLRSALMARASAVIVLDMPGWRDSGLVADDLRAGLAQARKVWLPVYRPGLVVPSVKGEGRS